MYLFPGVGPSHVPEATYPSPYDAVPLISSRWLGADWRPARWLTGARGWTRHPRATRTRAVVVRGPLRRGRPLTPPSRSLALAPRLHGIRPGRQRLDVHDGPGFCFDGPQLLHLKLRNSPSRLDERGGCRDGQRRDQWGGYAWARDNPEEVPGKEMGRYYYQVPDRKVGGYVPNSQPAHPVGSGRETDETDRQSPEKDREIELSFGVSPGSGCSRGPLQLNAGPPYRSRLYLCLHQLPRRPQSWRRLSVDGSAHWLYSARSRSIASTEIGRAHV